MSGKVKRDSGMSTRKYLISKLLLLLFCPFLKEGGTYTSGEDNINTSLPDPSWSRDPTNAGNRGIKWVLFSSIRLTNRAYLVHKNIFKNLHWFPQFKKIEKGQKTPVIPILFGILKTWRP